MDARRRRQLGLIGGLLLFGAGAYALYDYYFSSQQKTEQEESTSTIRYTKKPITIVLSESIIASKLPINEILSKTTDVVLVVPPELSIEDLDEKLDPSVAFKAIGCDTMEGVWSVVKHLKSEIVFVVTDDLENPVPEDVQRYVGDVVELDQNLSVINESILASIVVNYSL